VARRILALSIVLMAASVLLPGLTAQEEEDRRTRLEKAREELQVLRAAAEKIPELEKRAREDLVDPWPEAIDLIDLIADFRQRYADLPVAPRARLLLPELHRRNGDPAAQSAVFMEMAEEETREAAKAKLEMEAAAIAAAWGDFARGRSAFEGLQSLLSAKDKVRFDKLARDWAGLERRRGRDISRAAAAISPDGRSVALQGRNRAQVDRILASLPMNPISRQLLEIIVPGINPKAPRSLRRFYFERLLLFHPDSEAAGELTPSLVKLLILDGDYEKAWLHHRAAIRRGRPSISAKEGKALRQMLDRIAARKLDLARNTRRLRTQDLRRRCGLRDPADLLLERYRDFDGDYPQSPGRLELGWLVAKASFDEAPNEAYELTRRLLASEEELAFRFEALNRARRWLESNGDTEAIAALLAAQAPRLKDPRQRATIALDRAQILAREDRPEEALALLEPLSRELKDPVALGALKKKIAELRQLVD
jgi:hypothetical protein